MFFALLHTFSKSWEMSYSWKNQKVLQNKRGTYHTEHNFAESPGCNTERKAHISFQSFHIFKYKISQKP